MRYTIGIDEAGRGCVLGPLVIACVVSTTTNQRWFRMQDVRDSKCVPPKEREWLAAHIQQRCWSRVRVILPAEIDDAVRNRRLNLNGLELHYMSDLLRECLRTFDSAQTRARIDAPGTNARAIQERLVTLSQWPNPHTLDAFHHADQRDRTVAAASIIAKHTRDTLLEALKSELGTEFGCGYPHDERTREFLRTCPPNAPYVRWSWKTMTQLRPEK